MDFISLDRMFGLYPSGRRGFGGSFTIRSMVNKSGPKSNESPKTKYFLFKKETKSKKNIFERANLARGFLRRV